MVICKGTGNAKGYGCGNDATVRKYGLCFPNCYKEFLSTSDFGKELIQKKIIQARKFQERQRTKVKSEKIKDQKANIETANQFRVRVLQKKINKIARLIDVGLPCISSGLHVDEYDAGHFISTGANVSQSLNLHNIHKQSVFHNRHKGGANLEYYRGLIVRYGQDYADYCLRLKGVKLKHSKAQLEQVNSKTNEVFRMLDGMQ